MSVPNSKPDLEDSINVSEAHGRLVREAAATAREKRIADNGREPVALWVVVASGVATLIAGSILGSGGNWFNYKSTFRENYVRSSAPGGDAGGAKPKPALDAYKAKGGKLYAAKCSGCHGADAKGDGSNYPSLAGSKRVLGATDAFAMVILNGIQGPVSSGKSYGAGLMPPQGAGMSAEDLAGLMTYIRNNFGNDTKDVVTVDMAKAALEISGKRANPGNPVTNDEVEGEHGKMLPGDVLPPDTLVNPATLAPAPAAP
jgi:mono/diheme cytochrome c family protein